ncbi:MAG: hypothetical protein ABSF15_13635 [Candidatus Sulfotelmatobacter sp.]|jgi:hypothetical protein
MNAEMEAQVLATVAEIEKGMQPDEFLMEVRQHLTLSINEFSTPVCDSKLKEFSEGLLAKVTPALGAASTPDEKWNIAKTARDAFRMKLEALGPERSAEFQKILALREPWRTRGKTTPLGACSAPESICPSKAKVEEIF